MMNEQQLHDLTTKCRAIRCEILTMVNRANSGHVGGSLSSTEMVVALYYHLMKHDPSRPDWPERDRFILSKGHCTPVIYAVLADCGYFPKKDLETFRQPGSHLQGHPYQPKTPGIEATTGSLAIGFSTGLGMATAAKLKGESQRYYIICGDGELQEGEIWEGAMFANKYKLDNVIAFVDRNYLQTDGNSEDIMPLDPLAPKWESFGWQTYEIDGHDLGAIVDTVKEAQQADKPVMIIAYTKKGRGVSFMENVVDWHGTPPQDEDLQRALTELID